MKRLPHPFLLLMAFLTMFQGVGMAQSNNWKRAAKSFQKQLNHQYRDPKDSPLDSLDRIGFKHHDFFPISKAFYVPVTFVRTPDEKPFEMPTVSGKTKTFVKYGELHFTLNGRKDTLSAYQNLKLASKAEYAEDLFIPFKDHASGEEAYGGGRYIDWKMPKSDKVYLDFNQCYNPYCAYSTGWSCPIPPQENYMDSKVLAGVKAWKGGH
ncbi:MAG: DUF1684 domain-containing protein [Bacteroidetes bacterium]|nr:DUF1684 domain-containing protein [Bacteroidota bacterium]